MTEEKLLTIKALAELLDCSTDGVRKWMRTQNLPFIKIGGSLRFSRDSVLEWIKDLERRAA
jgi:excisionase family DNA binding protein